jgi:hypothetical protein
MFRGYASAGPPSRPDLRAPVYEAADAAAERFAAVLAPGE